jgi:4-hydroxythreonine-4-phosphate dehydrogenase
MPIPRIVVTAGEPAGIGPDIIIKLAQHPIPAEILVVADPALLVQRAAELGLPLTLTTADFTQPASINKISELKIIPVALTSACAAGTLNPDNAAYVIKSLEIGAELALNKTVAALVTGPVHKSILNDAGIAFTGHTEFLANYCGASQVLMFFMVDNMKVALATTHIPLAAVSKAITTEKLCSQLQLLHTELQNKFNIAAPKILVCGLNPHAGEAGHLGREEIEVITPALKKLRADNINVVGPLPADTIFTKHVLANADAVFAMYHDQALPVIKYLGFERAVNVTLGLPIIRTSVDHGTALDVAGTIAADAGSLIAAVKLAIQLANATVIPAQAEIHSEKPLH